MQEMAASCLSFFRKFARLKSQQGERAHMCLLSSEKQKKSSLVISPERLWQPEAKGGSLEM